MDPLKQKLVDLSTLYGWVFEYILEDGTQIEMHLERKCIPHLLGLHKLVDVPILGRFADKNDKVVNAKYILSKIKKEILVTDSVVRSSVHFPKIKERYESIGKEVLLSLCFTEAVIDFNPALINSMLQAQFLLFEDTGNGYRHLSIVKEGSTYFPESYFFEQSDKYVRGQTTIKVKRVRFLDSKGCVQLEETLF